MFGGGPSHSNVGTGNPPLSPAVLWDFNGGVNDVYDSDQFDSSPAVVNGVVYEGADDGNVYALNATNGEVLWNYTTGGVVRSSPAVVDGVIYLGSDSDNVFAVGDSITSYSTSSTAPVPTPPTVYNSSTTITAITVYGSVDLAISGNITSAQISNATITTNPSNNSTTVSFTVTGKSGTMGFGNITIPISAVPYGTTPEIYIDGQQAQIQGYTQYGNNYYVWFTTHFSTHKINIVFTKTASPPNPTISPSQTTSQSSSLLQVICGAVGGVAVAATVLVLLKLTVRAAKNEKSNHKPLDKESFLQV